MRIEWNRVTWYSKLIAVIVFLAIVGVFFKLGMIYGGAAATLRDYSQSSEFQPHSVVGPEVVLKNASATISAPAVAPSARTSLVSEASLFGPLLSDLRQQTDVPILLPSKLPQDLKTLPLYASISTAAADSYAVLIEGDPNCDGADACFIGEIFAQRNGKLSFPQKVSLTNNVSGDYEEGACGASCSPNSLEWEENGILYTLQFNESESGMISLADSMIQGGIK